MNLKINLLASAKALFITKIYMLRTDSTSPYG